MLIFPLLALPLVLAFSLTLKRVTIGLALWQMALGFLTSLPLLVFFAITTGNGLVLNWASPIRIMVFYFFDSFFLPSVLALACYYGLVIFSVIKEEERNLSHFFFLTLLAVLVAVRLLAFSHTFGLYELIIYPFLYMGMAFLLGAIASRISRRNYLISMLVIVALCLANTASAYFMTTDDPTLGLALGVVVLSLQLLIAKLWLSFKK